MADNVVKLLPKQADIGIGLLPAGEYLVAFARHAVTTRFRRGSLELWFKVADYGPFFGCELCRYYRVDRDGKRSFRASRHSAYCREFVAVHGKAPPSGIQGIAWYRDLYLRARVRVVERDHGQRRLDDALRYNVIDALISRAEP